MLKKYFRANKGFTLVELLVAITILGVASAAVIHAFVTSSNITARSKTFGEATGGADNIAEVIDAFPKDSVVSGAPDVAAMLGVDQTDMYKISDNQVVVKNVNSGGVNYDALLTYSVGDKDSDDQVEKGVYELNDYEIAQYTAMDGSYTQSYKPEENPDVLADDVFYSSDGAQDPYEFEYDADDNPIHAKYRSKNRLISVNVYSETNPGTGEVTGIYMDVVYNYTYRYYQKKMIDGVWNGEWQWAEFVTNPESFTYSVIFSTRDDNGNINGTSTKFIPTEDKPEPNVFINYYPDYDAKKYAAHPRYAYYIRSNEAVGKPASYAALDAYSPINETTDMPTFNYNSSSGSFKGKDLIVINNLGNLNTRFFIVKQRPVDASGTPVTDNYLTSNALDNASYRACIVQRFTDMSIISDDSLNRIYTNAGISLYEVNGLRIPLTTFTAYKMKDAWSVEVTYTSADEHYVHKDLVSSEKTSRYYKITVDVYKQDSLAVTEREQITDSNGNVTETLYDYDADGRAPSYSFVGNKLN